MENEVNPQNNMERQLTLKEYLSEEFISKYGDIVTPCLALCDVQLMDDKVYLEQGSKKSIILLKDLEYETYESVKERELREKAIRRDNLYNKPAYDPYGKYDYNKTAREQISDAYDGESDALWNTD